MLANIHPPGELRAIARAKGNDYDSKTVSPLLEEEALAEGWHVYRRLKRSVKIRRRKAHGVLFEDRVWSLLYRMGFTYLSGAGGASLTLNPADPESPKTKIDAVALDDEVALAIECKSAEKFARRPQFQEELGKHQLIRERFSAAVRKQFPAPARRQTMLAMFTSNIVLSENDRKRAEQERTALFDEQDLIYYEALVAHLGPAARYQFLADMLPGKPIPGLEIKVPAIRSKMAGHNCYSFSISPEYLLKIAYVSHRAKGKASDVNTYQRMIKRSRLRSLREYIAGEDGIFPTNIVISLDRAPRFDRREQEGTQEGVVMGWLELRPAYKSAWIIDGQHRLFAYSGQPRARSSRLTVLAFEGLPPSTQAQLFININAEQKSVKQSLLQELYAELHWNASDPKVRIRAVISKSIQTLDVDPESPFYGRILTADERRDPTRCISLASVFRALNQPDLYVNHIRGGSIPEYGPLWAGDSNEATMRRTCAALNGWFGAIRQAVPEWWQAGAGEGGGLAMNDSVTAMINVLRSVFQHLSHHRENLVALDDDDLVERLAPYTHAIGTYFGSLSADERRRFRDLRGIQGQTTRANRCKQAIHDQIPAYDPPGLREFIEEAEVQTNAQAKAVIDRIEKSLQRTIVEELQREFGLDEAQWWMQGVPKSVRLKATKTYEDDDGRRGRKELYLDLIDYRDIIRSDWSIFGELLGFGNPNMSKDKRTQWIVDVNDVRKIVAHASSGGSVSVEQLAQLENYEGWLVNQITGQNQAGSN